MNADGTVLAIGVNDNWQQSNAGYVRTYEWDPTGSSWTAVPGLACGVAGAGSCNGLGGDYNEPGTLYSFPAPDRDNIPNECYTMCADEPTCGGFQWVNDKCYFRVSASCYTATDANRVCHILSRSVRVKGVDIEGEAVGDQLGSAVALSADGNTLVIGRGL